MPFQFADNVDFAKKTNRGAETAPAYQQFKMMFLTLCDDTHCVPFYIIYKNTHKEANASLWVFDYLDFILSQAVYR